MADLKESLLVRNSSQESFHSLAEHPSPSSLTDPPVNQDSTAPQPSSQLQLPAFHAAGLPVYSVDAYLAAPENAALLRRAPDRKNAPTKQPNPGIDPTQPMPLGSKSSHYVSALSTLCQKKGLTPDYQIDGDASKPEFGGFLKVGDVTITSDERWHSKKEAKHALAQMGLEAVKGMETNAKEPSAPGVKDKNWIGMLHGECISRPSCRISQGVALSLTLIATRIPSIRRSTTRARLRRLLSRKWLQFHMYHPPPSGPNLRFQDHALWIQESRTCEQCKTSRRISNRSGRTKRRRQSENPKESQARLDRQDQTK